MLHNWFQCLFFFSMYVITNRSSNFLVKVDISPHVAVSSVFYIYKIFTLLHDSFMGKLTCSSSQLNIYFRIWNRFFVFYEFSYCPRGGCSYSRDKTERGANKQKPCKVINTLLVNSSVDLLMNVTLYGMFMYLLSTFIFISAVSFAFYFYILFILHRPNYRLLDLSSLRCSIDPFILVTFIVVDSKITTGSKTETLFYEIYVGVSLWPFQIPE